MGVGPGSDPVLQVLTRTLDSVTVTDHALSERVDVCVPHRRRAHGANNGPLEDWDGGVEEMSNVELTIKRQ